MHLARRIQAYFNEADGFRRDDGGRRAMGRGIRGHAAWMDGADMGHCGAPPTNPRLPSPRYTAVGTNTRTAASHEG